MLGALTTFWSLRALLNLQKDVKCANMAKGSAIVTQAGVILIYFVCMCMCVCEVGYQDQTQGLILESQVLYH